MPTRARALRAAAVTLVLAGSGLATLVAAAPADAVAVEVVALPGGGPTNGVAVTPDGSAWVAVQAGAASTLVRVSPLAR